MGRGEASAEGDSEGALEAARAEQQARQPKQVLVLAIDKVSADSEPDSQRQPQLNPDCESFAYLCFLQS